MFFVLLHSVMASFFGEIIEPSTRAIFEEFSDDDEAAKELEFQLSWTSGDAKLPWVIDVFFVVQGRLSLAFAEIFLINDNSPAVAEINLVQNDIEDNEEYSINKSLPSKIYVGRNKTFCLVSPSVSPECGYEFCQAIHSFLKVSKKVIVLTNDSLYNYKTPILQDLPFAFIKQLKTSHGSQKYAVEPMETPNFITGIPAGVISWCQVFKKDASAFICYTDQEKLDSITANPYLSALNKSIPGSIINDNIDLNKKTYYGNPKFIGGSSNIYM